MQEWTKVNEMTARMIVLMLLTNGANLEWTFYDDEECSTGNNVIRSECEVYDSPTGFINRTTTQ